MNYAVLRETGMEWIRLWARDSWTDHNVHDPGITLLEASSYSMTELGLRLQLDVADLLRSGERRGAVDFEPAHQVLPMGPVNVQDLRSVLLDHPLVSDAQIFLPADNEVAFFEAAGDPPLTYTAGTPRVRTAGLYEVLVELAERELNSNTYSLQVSSGGQNYDIEAALPYWDDAEAAPFREPVVVNAVSMIPDAGDFWRALPESQSFFGRMNIAYADAFGTPGTMEAPVLLRIATLLTQPGAVIPGILAAARGAIESSVANAPVLRFATRVRSAALAVAQLVEYVAGWRNLGEQAVRIGLARVQEIAVNARLEVTGGIDVELLFARIFMDIDGMLSPRVRFHSLAERRAQASDPEIIFDGPLLRRGFLDRATSAIEPPDVIYTSDILRLIMQRRRAGGTDVVAQENPAGRDIVAVTDLTLANFINNRPITTAAEDCLHLVQTARYRPRLSLAKSRISAVRNDSEVPFDSARVANLFSGLQAEAQANAVTGDPSPLWPVVPGDALPVDEFTPLQMDLPALYGVGDAALPDSASPERQAAVKQLQGYLLLFEQFLGDLTSQLGHINRFYSGDDDPIPTYFTRAPFDLPGAQTLLRRFPAGSDWATFIADPDNPVARALGEAAENRERLLDRRNRVLDHRLARQGEDAAALGQEVHRWARAELDAASLPPAQQEARIAERREAANLRLLRLKATLLRETPELNALRLLATGNRFVRDSELLHVESAGAGFLWVLSLAGQQLLRAVDQATTAVATAISAERAFAFAGRATNYTVIDIGGGVRRLQLMAGTGVAAPVLGESVQTFASLAAANAARDSIAAAFARARIDFSLSPMERRVAHHSGFRDASRRRALTPVSEYFEIFDEPAGPGLFGRRWRLRESPITGPVMFVSPVRYDAPTIAQAVELAETSIRQVLRYGLDEWNYRVVPAAGNTFAIEMREPANALLALAPANFATLALARQAIVAAAAHLYRHYGAEAICLLEHVLLRPRRAGDGFLSLPVGNSGRERDPYSHRLSLVLPSGYARDFVQPPATAVRIEVTPDRFRDSELRRHVEGMVQRACPAHLQLTLYWVDRQAPGTATSPASFDAFESRYHAWLETLLLAGAPPAAVDLARNQIVEALNAIANDG